MPSSSYVGGRSNGSSAVTNGEDLITEAGGGIVAVSLEYRLGVFGQWQPFLQSSLRSNPREFYFAYFSTWIGFLAGQEVKQKGALNAGLRE